MADTQTVIDPDDVVTEGELIAVIVISVLDFVLLVIQIALLIYCFCSKRCCQGAKKEPGERPRHFTEWREGRTRSDEELLVRDTYTAEDSEKPVIEHVNEDHTPRRLSVDAGDKKKKDDDEKEKDPDDKDKNGGSADPTEAARKLEEILSPRMDEDEQEKVEERQEDTDPRGREEDKPRGTEEEKPRGREGQGEDTDIKPHPERILPGTEEDSGPRVKPGPPDTDPRGRDVKKPSDLEGEDEQEDIKSHPEDSLPGTEKDSDPSVKPGPPDTLPRGRDVEKPSNLEGDDGQKDTNLHSEVNLTGTEEDSDPKKKPGPPDTDPWGGDVEKLSDLEGEDEQTDTTPVLLLTPILREDQDPQVGAGLPDTDPKGKERQEFDKEDGSDADVPGYNKEGTDRPDVPSSKSSTPRTSEDEVRRRQVYVTLPGQASGEDVPVVRDDGEVRGRGKFRRPISEHSRGLPSGLPRFSLPPIGVVGAWTDDKDKDKPKKSKPKWGYQMSPEEDQGYSDSSRRRGSNEEGTGSGPSVQDDRGTRDPNSDGTTGGVLGETDSKGKDGAVKKGKGKGISRPADRMVPVGEGYTPVDDTLKYWPDSHGRYRGWDQWHSDDDTGTGETNRDPESSGKTDSGGTGKGKGSSGQDDGTKFSGKESPARDDRTKSDKGGAPGITEDASGERTGKGKQAKARPRGKRVKEVKGSPADDEHGGDATVEQQDRDGSQSRGENEDDSGISNSRGVDGSSSEAEVFKRRFMGRPGEYYIPDDDVCSVGDDGWKYWPDTRGRFRGMDQWDSDDPEMILDDLELDEVEFDDENHLMRTGEGFVIKDPNRSGVKNEESKRKSVQGKSSSSRSQGGQSRQGKAKDAGYKTTVNGPDKDSEERLDDAEGSYDWSSDTGSDIRPLGRPANRDSEKSVIIRDSRDYSGDGAEDKYRKKNPKLRLGRGLPSDAILEEDSDDEEEEAVTGQHPHSKDTRQREKQRKSPRKRKRGPHGENHNYFKNDDDRQSSDDNDDDDDDDKKAKEETDKRRRKREANDFGNKQKDNVPNDVNPESETLSFRRRGQTVGHVTNESTVTGPPGERPDLASGGLGQKGLDGRRKRRRQRRRKKKRKTPRSERGPRGYNENSWDAYLEHDSSYELYSPLRLIFMESDDDYR